jgi:hypothetical protein
MAIMDSNLCTLVNEAFRVYTKNEHSKSDCTKSRMPTSRTTPIVALIQSNSLSNYTYDIQGNSTGIGLNSSPQFNVQDMTSYYTPRDNLRHVILATKEGALYEITYTSQG